MRHLIFAFCICLPASPCALSQDGSGTNCGTAKMVETGSTYSCPGNNSNEVYPATGSFTYQDTCYNSSGVSYSSQSSTVSGTGQCAVVPGVGKGATSNCPPVNSTSIVYATKLSGQNAMYNYAYNTTISWPPLGGSFSCPKTGGFSQSVMYCASVWCGGGGCSGSAPCEGGGGPCFYDDDCGGDECCYDGYCSICQVGGQFDPDRQIRNDIRGMARRKHSQGDGAAAAAPDASSN